MALVDRALRWRELGEDGGAPAQDEEFVLAHCDNIQASGFLEHIKLPHYADLIRNLRPKPCAALRAEALREHIMTGYTFAYLDEQTKRAIRRAMLKAVAIPGYQVPFSSREMPMPYGWGTGGVQVTAACLVPEDVLKVIDKGGRHDQCRLDPQVLSEGRRRGRDRGHREATMIQTRHRIPETPLDCGGADPCLSGAHSRTPAVSGTARDRDAQDACAGRIRADACAAV
jgi:hypothetical protein